METQLSVTVCDALTIAEALDIAVAVQRPTFVWGSPGIGKSDIIRQLAARCAGVNVAALKQNGSRIVYTAADGRRSLLIDLRASQLDAVDVRGVPFVADVPAGELEFTSDELAKATRWAVPSMFPSARDAEQFDTIVLFLDELNSAHRGVQAALYQLILDRALGDYVLPANCVVLAAGNKETDRAIAERMSTALAARFTHLELVVDAKAWERWALDAGLHLAVVTYMRWQPAALHEFDPRSSSKAQPNPRAWEAVSKFVYECEKRAVRKAVEGALYKGTVGESRGQGFLGYLQFWRDLPDPQSVIDKPDSAPISDRPDILWALCGALAERATKENFPRIVRYAERLKAASHAGPEFMTLVMRASAAKNPAVQETKAFIKWASENSDVYV